MNIRMIGFDLDGTLLTTDKILTERTKKALEAAADQGVILVTGGRDGHYVDFQRNFWSFRL